MLRLNKGNARRPCGTSCKNLVFVVSRRFTKEVGGHLMEHAANAFVRNDGSIRSLAEIEAMAISHALQSCRGAADAARKLGIGRSTLYRKLDEIPSLRSVFMPPQAAPKAATENVPSPAPASQGVQNPRSVRSLVRSMKSESLTAIQAAVKARFGEHKSLGEIADLMFN